MVMARDEAQAFYDGTAEAYADVSAKWWADVSDQALQLLGLGREEHVLDVGCGPGGLAVRAAQLVGRGGSVVGMDRSPSMLAVARDRAVERGVRNVELVQADVDRFPLSGCRFDAVVCVFALHAVRDPAAVLAWMWARVRPGGRLVVVTPGRAVFAPLLYPYLGAVRREGVEVDWLAPWRRLAGAAELGAVMADARVPDVALSTDLRTIPVGRDLAEWDRIVAATEMGRPQRELSADAAARVRADVATWAADHGVTELELGAVYARATKPAVEVGVRIVGRKLAGELVG